MPSASKVFKQFALSPQAIDEMRAMLNDLANPRVFYMLWNTAGSAVPNGTTLANTLGLSPTWSRLSTGTYLASFNGSLFTAGKTFITPGGWPAVGTGVNLRINFALTDSQKVTVTLGNTAGTAQESAVTDFPFTIELFN